MNIDKLVNSLMGWSEEIYGGGAELKEAATMLRELQTENKVLKAENQFFKDIMGDVELLRKAQKK